MAPTVTPLDKCAVLLSQLDARSLDKVLEMLGPEFSGKLKPVLASVNRRKDLVPLSAQILQEFKELQEEVRASIAPSVPAPPAAMNAGSPVRSAGSTPQPPLSAARSTATSATARPPGAGSSAPPSPTTAPGRPAPLAGGTHQAGSTPPTAGAVAAAAAASVAAGNTTSAPSSAVSLSSMESGESPATLAEFGPAVLAAALKNESPRMIATLLQQIPAETGGKALEALPPELRQSVFLMMADPVQVPKAIVDRVLQRLIEVCRNMDPAAIETQDRRIKSLIGILQSVEREERLRLMESLTQHDPQLAAQLDNSLYDYADLLRIEDRSLQKLLSQLEQRVVATALKTAPEDLRQKVFKNLSERVRLALNEEMDLLSGLTNSKIDAARQEIAGVIRTQDKEGSLVWIE